MKKLSLCVAMCALFAGGATARAQSALVGDVKPVEMRIAVADASLRTVWTSLRVADAGPFALVVPLPDGAFVDQSSDAWFEALEIATAPRVLPPEALNPFCPGQNGASDPYDIAGSIAHTESLSPQQIALADDAPAVASWASTQGLTLGASTESALATSGAKRFLCVRFNSPGGDAITATLRVSSPQGLPSLPFSITRAPAASSLRVTTWLIGGGRGDLLGTQPILVPAAEITWDAKTLTSDYATSRDALLSPAPDGVTLESTGHAPFAETIPFANDTAAIAPVVTTYFDRAATYGNASSDGGSCAASAKPLFASDAPVSATCPRGDLAAPPIACAAKPPLPAEIDAADLACGPGADDLAIALAGASPKATWLTRRAFVIAQGSPGKDRAFVFGAGATRHPIVEAGSVDVSDCFGEGGAGGATGTTTSTGTVTGTNPNNSGHNGQGGGTSYGQGGYGEGATGAGYGYGGYDDYSAGDAIGDIACACASTAATADTTSDGCSGDTTYGGETTADGCSGDGEGTSDACSGDTAGSSADSCSSDTSSTSDCAVSAPGGRKSTPPRMSVLTFLALAFLLPWRRRGSRTKRPG